MRDRMPGTTGIAETLDTGGVATSPHEPMIALDRVAKRFTTGQGEIAAVADVSFAVEAGSWVTLLGPSGCGKTTILRMVAGLETPSNGVVSIAGRVVAAPAMRLEVPVHKRPIGMVFQSYALWPHMTIFQNVAFPLRIERPRIRRAEVRSRVEEVLELVGLPGMADRPITALSGGQQQRVALARALIRQPSVLLLDEPLSNLDAGLRQKMCAEMRALQERTGVTTLFVTHDQTEALAMSDQIVLLRDGLVVQAARPRDLFEQPCDPFAAHFVGVSNQITGTVGDRTGEGQVEITTAAGTIRCELAEEVGAGTAVRLMFRPESVTLAEATAGQNGGGWHGEVVSSLYQGGHTDYEVRLVDGSRMRARVSNNGAGEGHTALSPGSAVAVVVQPNEVSGFPVPPS